jgi:hypothetical protein
MWQLTTPRPALKDRGTDNPPSGEHTKGRLHILKSSDDAGFGKVHARNDRNSVRSGKLVHIALGDGVDLHEIDDCFERLFTVGRRFQKGFFPNLLEKATSVAPEF